MKTLEKVLEENQDLIVAFHIGRGGRFHNSGHTSYIGEKNINDFTSDFFLNRDETFYIDCNGKEILAVDNDGTGKVNIDNDYDTTYACKVSDLSEEEINIILATKDERGYFGQFAEEMVKAENEENEENEDEA